VAYADYIIFAIPSANDELEKLTVSLENKVIFSAIKGIVPETSMIVGEHFHSKYIYHNIGVITGPCHAEEVLEAFILFNHRLR
jgi:glycerol-3-phosphate dehydrogenase (NAD(P)+)